MQPIVVIQPQMIQTLHHQLAMLLSVEVDLFEQFNFTDDELTQAGWTPELIAKIEAIIDKMKMQLRGTGLVTP